jgi:hypothetical protein
VTLELTWPICVPVDATRLLVCGGQLYTDRERVYSVLSELNPAIIIHGAAPGADTLAHEWALSSFPPVGVIRFLAHWTGYGRRMAGFARNIRMLREGRPTLVCAFPGRAGTEHMVHIADDAGVPVIRVPA